MTKKELFLLLTIFFIGFLLIFTTLWLRERGRIGEPLTPIGVVR